MPLAGLGLGVLLAPMSGSVGASVAMLSRTVQPRLAATGYAEDRNVALVCVASTLGVVVPPSLVLILLGDAMMRAHTEAANPVGLTGRIVNTQDVFHAALVPGGAALLALCVAIVAWQGARGKPRDGTSRRRRPRRMGDGASSRAALIVALLAAVTLGYLYAVEAAATGGMALVAYGLATRTLAPSPRGHRCARRWRSPARSSRFSSPPRSSRWCSARSAPTAGSPRRSRTCPAARTRRSPLSSRALAACALVLDAFEMIFVVVPLVMPALLARVPDATWVAVLTLLILQASFLVPPFGYAVLMARGPPSPHVGTRPSHGHSRPMWRRRRWWWLS